MEEVAFPTAVDCKICHNITEPGNKFCSYCGYPVGGTEYEQNEFDFEYETKRYQLNNARAIVKSGTNTLYVLSGLIFLGNLVLYFVKDDVGSLIVGILLPLIFLGLAYWSKQKPFTALLSALLLYASLLVISAFADPMSILSGIIVKIIVIGALVKAVRGGREAQDIIKELNARNWNQ